jgi:hypothetical protein
MDWWQHSGRVEYLQEGKSYVPLTTCAGRANTYAQMWVEKDEWQENPDIIHTKFA